MPLEYDDIIVGAGSSGAVLAARLSEDPSRSVLLLEAGPDYATVEGMPHDLLDGHHASTVDHDWGFTAEAVTGRMVRYARGKVTGGSSAVNSTVALRGVPADYDEWAALGNDAWSWATVLPSFRRLEDDQDERGDWHGSGGPIPIRRFTPDELQPPSQAFLAVCRRLGLPAVRDHNDPESTGVGPVPVNQRDGVRVSTAIGYLLPARHRLNLTIRPHCLVTRVVFDGDRAVGVEVESGGETQTVVGRRVTLSAGAIGSPAILLRSGIGPAADLRALGIAPRVDAPGVGANLMDHPLAMVPLVPKAGSYDPAGPWVQVVARITAPGSDAFNDLQLYMGNLWDVATNRPEAAAAFGSPVVVCVLVSLVRPRSRGRLALASSDPHTQPAIHLNLLDDPEDMRRMAAGLRLGWQVATAPEVLAHTERIPLLTEEMFATDAATHDLLRATVSHTVHIAGTAKMGPASDPMAVVDQYGRVRGVENLRVVDASVMPTIPRAPINLTCILIGERVADWMQAEARPGDALNRGDGEGR